MDAYTLLSDFRSRGIALIPNGEKLTVEAASRLSDADRAAIRESKPELLRILSQSIEMPERVIEATFSAANAHVREQPINPEFPACPDCKMARYWIAPSGKVVCGKCGETRFLLTSITYHAVN
jgi:TubC N-terminal docking domain